MVLVVVAGVLLTGGVLVWYLAYGVEQRPPKFLELDAVADTVQIHWSNQGAVSIEAGSLEDAMAALGYVHGRQRAWSVVLWRQAALGRLSEWFGEPALPLDRLTRRLALASLAQESSARLDAPDRATLGAYAAGLNAALQSPAVRLQQEFVLLGQEPEPWQPWHTLALERLFAWLASSPPSSDELAAAGDAATDFFEADRALRQWLHLYGFENSLAWITRDAAGVHFFQRHVYGDTALPFFQEIALALEGGQRFEGASLPGTPFFPAGKSEQAAWALLLTASPRLERIAWQPDSANVVYQRILSKGGAEHLISFWQLDRRLPFLPSLETPPDSVWSLHWQGLSPGSDCPAWRGLWTGNPAPFHLLDGNGLQINRDGLWRILGAPRLEVPLPSGVFVGTSPWARYGAKFLQNQASGPVPLVSWIDDAFSLWAAQTAPPLVRTVETFPTDAPAFQDAVTYLRNWDYTYDRASIAASIFDRWMERYLDTNGALPDSMMTLDSAMAVYPMLQTTLTQAVTALTDAFGPDQSQWRWERVHPDRRFFPIWSVDALRETGNDPGSKTRFRAVEWPGHGHPSALAWGSSSTQMTLAAPAAWEAWHHVEPWLALTVRRRHLDAHAPLGRYLISDRPPNPITLPPAVPSESTTTITPPS